jgi:hypothetical protein
MNLGNNIKHAMGNIYNALFCLILVAASAGFGQAQENPASPGNTNPVWIPYNHNSNSIDPGEYYIIFREVGSACVSDTAILEIKLREQPAAPVVGIITQPTCTQPSGSVVLSGLPEGNWTILPVHISGSGQTTTITGLVAGQSYAFTVTAGNGCTSLPSDTININPQPFSPAAPFALAQTLCVGSLVEDLVAQVPQGAGLRWYASLASTTPLLATQQLNTGTYYAVSVSPEGCESERISVAVSLNPLVTPEVAIFIWEPTICEGGDVVFFAIPTHGGTNPTYRWFVGNEEQSGFSGNEFTVYNQASNFSVKVLMTSNAACISGTNPVIAMQGIQVNSLPSLSVMHSECSPDMLTYTLHFESDGEVAASHGLVDTGSKTVRNIPVGQALTLTSSNTYGCQTTLEFESPVCTCPVIAAPESNGKQTICMGEPLPILSVVVGEGLTANWYSASNVLLASETLSYTPTMAGTYYTRAFHVLTACESDDSTVLALVVNELPGAPTALDQAFCYEVKCRRARSTNPRRRQPVMVSSGRGRRHPKHKRTPYHRHILCRLAKHQWLRKRKDTS